MMKRLNSGTAYMHYVEETMGRATDRKSIQLIDRARGQFLHHMLRELGCSPESAPQFSDATYYLPLGLARKIKKGKDGETRLFTEAVKSFPRFYLGGRRSLTGKQLWDIVTNNRVALPSSDALDNDDAEDQPEPETTETRKRKRRTPKTFMAYVQELFTGYGLEWMYKPKVSLSELIVPPANKRKRTSVKDGFLNIHQEGWQQTLTLMQFVARGQQMQLRLRGFSQKNRDWLDSIDVLLDQHGL